MGEMLKKKKEKSIARWFCILSLVCLTLRSCKALEVVNVLPISHHGPLRNEGATVDARDMYS